MNILDSIADSAGAAFDTAKSLVFGDSDAKRTLQHRYGSFAPERSGAHVRWYVDGKDYFFAVSEALSQAKQEIFIEDWWLSPELYLRRPPSQNEQYRLDTLLEKKAKEGVKVYVVVYKEMPKALTLDSAHSKEVLQSKHPNIVVQRHPDHFEVGGTFFWAHHEKICVVDRHIAFIGGLDLCFGRYDNHTHQLADNHVHSNNVEIWPGQDYSNPRIFDFIEVKDFKKTLVDRQKTARMPWHDVSIGMVGRPVLDVARHFIERWNFILKEKAENRPEVKVLVDKSDAQHEREDRKEDQIYNYFGQSFQAHHYRGKANVQILRSSSKWSHGIQTEKSIQTAYIETILKAKHFVYIENQFFITATEESKDGPVKNLIGKAIVDRIIQAAKKNEQFRIIVCMPLLPSFPAEVDTSDAGTLRLIINFQYESISRGKKSIFAKIKEAGYEPEKYISFFALRSWDRIIPSSVKKALGSLTDKPSAESEEWHSGAEPAVPHGFANEDVTGNYVTELLYIHTKLLIADDRYVIIGSANLNDRSQCGDHDSEIAAIIEDTEQIPSHLAGKPYQASKFAATLRRHLFKEHLGLVSDHIHDKPTQNSYPPPFPIDPSHVQFNKEDRIVEDPASPEFYKYWHNVAETNTKIFRDVFHCYPDDTVTSWEKYKNFIPDFKKIGLGHVCDCDQEVQAVKKKLGEVRGHLVQFPTHFLEDEELQGSVVFDAVTPMELFT